MKATKIKILSVLALAALSTMTSACSSSSNGNFLSGGAYRSTGGYSETIQP